MTDARSDKLKKYLTLFWLRPENGLMMAFKSAVFADIEFTRPSLDISCGDGLFMFIHMGGELSGDTDMFSVTKAREFSHDKFIDIYDTSNPQYSVSITSKPATRFECGTDWKQGLLDKAGTLGLYDNLLLHDNNNLPLPFETESFQTIYSNSVYWVSQPDKLLAEIYRILKPGGKAVMELKTPYLLSTLDRLAKYLSPDAISILNRQRRETMPGSLEYQAWKQIIDGIGFEILECRNVYPNKVLVDIWNIGLRPISHLLIRMSDAISDVERREIKQEWVDIIFRLFNPLLDLEENYTLDKAPYLCFVLSK